MLCYEIMFAFAIVDNEIGSCKNASFGVFPKFWLTALFSWESFSLKVSLSSSVMVCWTCPEAVTEEDGSSFPAISILVVNVMDIWNAWEVPVRNQQLDQRRHQETDFSNHPTSPTTSSELMAGLGFQISIIAGKDEPSSSVTASGQVQHIISDKERDTFKLNDSQLKNAVNSSAAKHQTQQFCTIQLLG